MRVKLTKSQIKELIRHSIRELTSEREDVTESKKFTYKPYTDVSGVPANQRLIGTDALRKYVETMVPGSTYGKYFINKHRKKSKE